MAEVTTYTNTPSKADEQEIVFSRDSEAADDNVQAASTDDIINSSVKGGDDEAMTASGGGATDNSSIYLRWSRLEKSVVVQEVNEGLMRSSIAGPSAAAAASKGTPGTPQLATTTTASSSSNSNNNNNNKIILNQVSAFAAPGQVLALLGPSGSGKTTLLNALSGRLTLTSGTISVNGRPISSGSSMKRFVSQVAYVRQQDIFFNDLTVRDQLTYTAFLRLPQNWTRQDKVQKVDDIVKLLRLNKVENSPIGMLSGGEKKRVNIGTELLTNPSCLLLDEPTSGLDSTNAVALVRTLQALARQQNKTVIVSIHQPSSGLFMSFDRLLMMASGHVVYFGTPAASIPYLRKHNMTCPEGYNLADHWMDLLVADASDLVEETQGKALESGIATDENSSDSSADTPVTPGVTKREILIEAWDGEAVSEDIDRFVEPDPPAGQKRESTIPGINNADYRSESKYSTDWPTQYRILVHRALKNSRTAIFTPLNLFKASLTGLVVGLFWFQLGYTEESVNDAGSFIFFTMTYWVFDSMFGALLAFPSEKMVIDNERASSSYHLSAYFLAKTTSEAPTRLTLPILYMIISYWMAGINDDFVVFLSSSLVALLSVLAGESFGLFVGTAVKRVDRAMTAATLLALSSMLVGGFFVENVPAFVKWTKYLSPFKYAFDASRFIVFNKDMPCDGSGKLQHLCVGGPGTFAKRDDLLEFLAVDGSLWFNVGMLITLTIVSRYCAYLFLKFEKRAER